MFTSARVSAVVGDGEAKRGGPVDRHLDRSASGTGVSGDIGEGFGHDAVGGDLDGGRERGQAFRGGHGDRQGGTAGLPVQPFDVPA
jgi:hypothetical protein